MTDMTGICEAAARSGDILLRTMGGRSVMLRLPAPAVANDPTEQLGLATPQFQDVPLAPVVYRKARATVTAGAPSFRAAEGGGGGGVARYELLISATAVDALAPEGGASALFATAAGIVIDGALLQIESFTEEQIFGRAYVYRVIVRSPFAQNA